MYTVSSTPIGLQKVIVYFSLLGNFLFCSSENFFFNYILLHISKLCQAFV